MIFGAAVFGFRLKVLLIICLSFGYYNVYSVSTDNEDSELIEDFDLDKILDEVKEQRLQNILNHSAELSKDQDKFTIENDPFQYPPVFNEQGDYFGNLDNPYEKISRAELENTLKLFSSIPELQELIAIFDNLDVDSSLSSIQIVLEGPPGVGKTTLSRALAAKAGLKYRFIDGAALFNAYKDSASSDLNHFIAPLVKQPNPCVIIIDEFTCITERYNQPCNGDIIPATALWMLLDLCLKHPKIIFIGLTNDASKLPPQLQSRLQCKFKLERPSKESRLVAFKNIFKSTPSIVYDFDDYDTTLSYIAKNTEGTSLRNISLLKQKIIIKAVTRKNFKYGPVRVIEKDVYEALKDYGYLKNPLVLFGQKFFNAVTNFSKIVAPYVIPWALSTVVHYWLHRDSVENQFNAQLQSMRQSKDLANLSHELNLKHMKTSYNIRQIELAAKMRSSDGSLGTDDLKQIAKINADLLTDSEALLRDFNFR